MSPQAELELINGLQRALDAQRLHMVYQPKVSLRDGGLRQVEALVLHPALEFRGPRNEKAVEKRAGV